MKLASCTVLVSGGMCHCVRRSAWFVILVLAGAIACSRSSASKGSGAKDAGSADTGGTDSGRADTGSGDANDDDTGSPQCGGEGMSPPTVYVVDGVTGKAICNAFLVDNDAGAALTPADTEPEAGATCAYGVLEGSGDAITAFFSVTIAAPGYAPAQVDGLANEVDGCAESSPGSPPMTISLTRVDGGDTPVAPPDAGP